MNTNYQQSQQNLLFTYWSIRKNGNGKHLLNVHSKFLVLKNIMLVINMCTGLFTELNCKWKSFKVDQAIYFRE